MCSAADRPAIRVCADPNNLPFSNRRGEGLENKLAQLIAGNLSARLEYVWFSERKNFLRNGLNANLCDLVPGVPVDVDGALVTRPYYRSTYVVVTRADRHIKLDSLYDPQLRGLRIGLHVVGDDYTPPGHLLAAEGLAGQIAGYSLFGAYGEPDPAEKLVEAVVKREVDVAIVWGPFAGYFAKTAPAQLSIEPVSPNRFRMIPFAYSIGVGVRKGDTTRQSAIQSVLDKEYRKIRALVAGYGFPLSEETSCATPSSAAAFSR